MKRLLKLTVGVLGMCLMVLAVPASGLSLFLTSDDYWFDPKDQTSVDAHIDLRGLSQQAVQKLVFEANANGLISSKNLTVLAGSDGEVRILAYKVFHSDLVKLRAFIETLKANGASSPSLLLPFAPRILDMARSEEKLNFAANVSRVRKRDLEAIAAMEKTNIPRGKVTVFRYFMDDLKVIYGAEYFEYIKEANAGTVMGKLKTGVMGQMPVMIDGESAIFHSRDYHSSSILAKYNPGLVNRYIQYFFTSNKYVEYLFWNKYAPGTMPETLLLEDVLKNAPQGDSLRRAEWLKTELNRRFPRGWVLKGTNESRTAKFLVTEKTDLQGVLQTYFNSSFDKFEKKIREEYAGADEDMVYAALQEQEPRREKQYFGWKINNYLTKPHTAIAQEKLQIQKEFRSDVLMGRVVNQETTDRFIFEGRQRTEDDPPSTKKEFARAESWVQSVLNRFKKVPEKWLYWMHGGWDYGLLQDGSYAMIESNMGVESSKWYDTDTQVEKLVAYLRSLGGLPYSKVVEGATPEEQMRFIEAFIREFKLEKSRAFPGMKFEADSIEPAYKPAQVANKYSVKALPQSTDSNVLTDRARGQTQPSKNCRADLSG